MTIHPGLDHEQLSGVVTILRLLLADECLLYSKTRNCDWNVIGPEFRQLHAVFERQFDELADIIDQVAGLSRNLGSPAMATMSEFLQYARLREHPGKRPPAARMIAHLLDDHEALARSLRGDATVCAEEFNDAATSGFLAGLIEQHERMARMLRAHLENS
jgi:starvation-inducible DNA-binding protein